MTALDRDATEAHRAETRLKDAFSPARNLRRLFVPPSGASHLRALDGLRALSILWVIFFHAGWYSFMVLPLPSYAAVLHAPWMLPIWRGDFGVDVFFVLSGFLVGGLLFDEHARTGRIRLGLFYVRRLLRLWPALAVGIVVNHVVIGDPWSTAWLNLFYVSNLSPVLGTGMAWTWSLAIEEQFYLAAPWLVRVLVPRGRVWRAALLTTVVATTCLLAGFVAHRRGFFAFDAEIALNRELVRWAAAFDALYSKPWMRAGPLLAGVAAAQVYRSRAAMAFFANAKWTGALLFLASLVVAGAATHWPLVFGAPRALELVYLASYRSAFGVAAAYVLLFVVSEHPLGRAVGRVLGARVLYPVAQLAYSAYLLNPIVAMGLQRVLAPRVVPSGVSPMAVFMPLELVVTLVSAAVLHLAVERPIMQLRPGSRP